MLLSQSNPWFNVTVPAPATSGRLEGLEYFTRYELIVHGYTIAGIGVGEWRTVQTEEDGEHFKCLLSVLGLILIKFERKKNQDFENRSR